MLVYVDSNIVIYLVEQPTLFGPQASARVATFAAAGDRIVVSDLTRLECRVHVITMGDSITLAQYDHFFHQAVERVMPLTSAVVDRATIIRARHRFKTPDALHLAAALESGCQLFLTNDARLNGFPDLRVESLS